MIDLHCHLLPGLDDGPGSIEEATELARESASRGIQRAVATPHYNDLYPTSYEDALAALDELRRAVSDAGIDLEIELGFEIAIDALPTIDEGLLRERTLADGDCLLIEPPFGIDPGNLEFAVHDLIVGGYSVLIAHPERSAALATDPELTARLVDRGAKLSITAASLRGSFGRGPETAARKLCAAGLVHNVSSDAHDRRRRRPGLDVGPDWPEGLPSEEAMTATASRLLKPDSTRPAD